LDQRADKISSAIILFTILDEDGNWSLCTKNIL
jgi:hypothetical protein